MAVHSGQDLTGADQTSADRDQTSAVSDQTSADSDQTSADSDQMAADRDQAASDRDLGSGVDPDDHDATRDIRRRNTRRRANAADARVAVASNRDRTARTRDLAAQARDEAADAREMTESGAGEPALDSPALSADALRLRVAEQHRRAAEDRARAARQRALAGEDRDRAQSDRMQAARERRDAQASHDELARQVAIAATDVLTGARARAAGLTELEHELNRCRRTGSRLVVAYIDVIGLKAVNDSQGHVAGDDLLRRVVALLRERLRPSDLIVRMGGDEFLCATSSTTLTEVRRRFDGEFRRVFEKKAPHQAVMADIPSYVIVGENSALQGLAAFARTPELFGVNLAGRRWSSLGARA